MSSRSSRRNEIGGAIGDQLRAIYDEVLNRPIADRFFELLDQLETDSKLVAHQKNTQKFAPSQSTTRISRNAPGIMPKSLAGRTKLLEPHRGKPLKSRETLRTLPSGYHHKAIPAVAAAADGRKSPP